MSNISEIKQRARALAEKTDVNSVTPQEVGGIMYDLGSYGEHTMRNGGTLGIRKVYASIEEMEADNTNPVDLWGDPIKKGNLVVIYDGANGEHNNEVYAFLKPGWKLATNLDAGYAMKAETDAKLSELGREVVETVVSGESAGKYNWLNKVDFKTGSLVRNTGEISIQLFNVYGSNDAQKMSLAKDRSVILPFDVAALRETDTAGFYELKVSSGFRAEFVEFQKNVLTNTIRGEVTSQYVWLNDVFFKAGSIVTNTGDVSINLYSVKDAGASSITLRVGEKIQLPSDIVALRATSMIGNYNLTVVGGVRAEIEKDIINIENQISDNRDRINDIELDLNKEIYSGESTGKYEWLNDVFFKAGSIVTNTGDVSVNFYKEKVGTSDKYITLQQGGTIILPYNIVAIRSTSMAGKYEFNVVRGARAEIEEDLKELRNEIGNIEPAQKLNHLSNKTELLSETDSLTIPNAPSFIKIGDEITLFAKVDSFGNGITVGKGNTNYTAGYLEINSTKCILKSYRTNEQTVSEVEHGLIISDFIKVIIGIDNGVHWKVIVQTLQGTFNHTFSMEANAGTPRVTSNGAVLTDVSLTYFNPYLWSKVWAFGDSYFGITSANREMYWLKEWGYLNFMLSGYPGAASSVMYSELERCISIAKPEYVIWCLGMNDNGTFSSWESYINKVLTLCEANGVKVVLSTIPEVRNNTSYLNKDEMSNWVKNSGQRYIDVQKAVGADSEGNWYGDGTDYDYQSSDNVHPTEYGAKAIATQFIVDVPEIMHY